MAELVPACAPQSRPNAAPLPADRANVVAPGGGATVHARHSLTASLAQPWASYANPWHIGATMIAKSVRDDGATSDRIRMPTLPGSRGEG
jgi:hypothetical protein